jgi:hypothetical protein
MSLREPIMAIDNVAGPHTITFAPAPAGQAIVLTQQLPLITQDHITLTGLTLLTVSRTSRSTPAGSRSPGGRSS